jgi:hypothetical protein
MYIMHMFCNNCGNISFVFPAFQIRKSNEFGITEKDVELLCGKGGDHKFTANKV